MRSAKSAVGLPISAALPDGCRRWPLAPITDHRGDFTELFRNVWFDTPPPIQWNLSRSGANVLRGVHVHARHWDYVIVLGGHMTLGLHDMRPDSATWRASAIVELSAGEPAVISIPPGVAHGFYFPVASLNLTGNSRYYDAPDHRRCRWDCAELGIDWPCAAPDLSPADEKAGDYAELEKEIVGALAAARSAS